MSVFTETFLHSAEKKLSFLGNSFLVNGEPAAKREPSLRAATRKLVYSDAVFLL